MARFLVFEMLERIILFLKWFSLEEPGDRIKLTHPPDEKRKAQRGNLPGTIELFQKLIVSR